MCGHKETLFSAAVDDGIYYFSNILEDLYGYMHEQYAVSRFINVRFYTISYTIKIFLTILCWD
jgi:hypothetical protein